MNKNIIQLTEKHVAGTYGRYPIALVKGKGTKSGTSQESNILTLSAAWLSTTLGIATHQWYRQ